MPIRTVALDVGETLIDETRILERWAERLEVPRTVLMAAIGGMIAADRPVLEAFRLIRPGFDLDAELAAWRAEEPESLRERFDAGDLYPDVRGSLAELRAAGFEVVIAGNQPIEAGPALEAMDLPATAIATSDGWGAAKPDPAFFHRLRELAGRAPEEILYVGDRLDNDVLAPKAAGMRAALLRRGPFGYLHSERPEAASADLLLDDLHQLPRRLREHGL